MAESHCFPSTQHSKPSPDGHFIATILQSSFILRSSRNGERLRTIPLDTNFATRCRCLRWSRGHGTIAEAQEDLGVDHPARSRILLADEDTVRVYDAYDSQWSAKITAASSEMGRIANVEFGRTSDEILVFSDFGLKVTHRSLISSRGVEIRDPKFATRGYSFRPEMGHLAILTRQTAHDLVMVLAPVAKELLASFTLATVDAQGLVWSPNGKWLVTWDAASSGYKVLVYTADGHLYRTMTGGQNASKVGLGVKSVTWSAEGTYLAVGDYDGRVSLLNATTFSLKVALEHTATIYVPRAKIWQEQIDASKKRTYAMAAQPICPPTSKAAPSPTESIPKTGVSIICFSSDGMHLATKCDSTPTTIWIWPMGEAFVPLAILIHHSPIKNVQWHPTLFGLLMIHCLTDESVLHLWSPFWDTPRILNLPLDKPGGRLEAAWLHAIEQEMPRIMLGNAHNYIVESVYDDDDVGTAWRNNGNMVLAGPEDMFDEGNSMDLSPIKLFGGQGATEAQDDTTGSGSSGESSGDVDDTFLLQRQTTAPF